MESTIGLLKTESINAREIEWELASWAHWYNSTRLHSSIGCAPPIEYEQSYRERTAATPDRESA